MPKRTYIRSRDHAEVPEQEALSGGILRDGYSMSDILQPGERLAMPIMLMDSTRGSAILRDAAGAPTTLYDEATGGQLKLNEDLIAAIEAEAAKLNMTVNDYVQHVLKYSWAKAHLAGSPNPSSPAERA